MAEMAFLIGVTLNLLLASVVGGWAAFRSARAVSATLNWRRCGRCGEQFRAGSTTSECTRCTILEHWNSQAPDERAD